MAFVFGAFVVWIAAHGRFATYLAFATAPAAKQTASTPSNVVSGPWPRA